MNRLKRMLILGGLLMVALGLARLAPLSAQQRIHSQDEEDQLANQVKEIAGRGTPEAAHEALPYLDHEWTRVRDWAYVQLAKATDPRTIEIIASEGLFSQSARVRGDSAEILGKIGAASAVPALLRLFENDRETRLETAWALGQIGEFDAFEVLAEEIEDRDWRLRSEIGEALFHISPRDAAPYLREQATGDREWTVRARALILFARIDQAAGVELANGLLEEAAGNRRRRPAWQLTLAALDAIRNSEGRGALAAALRVSMDRLITLLGVYDGRMLAEVHDTLIDLTGQSNLAMDPSAWESWWDVTRDRWSPVESGTTVSDDGRGTTLRFHGIPIHSNRILFVIDLSGSMTEPITYHVSETRGIGSSSRDAGGETRTVPRMQLSKEQLVSTITALPEDAAFNLIFFATEMNPWQEQLVEASERNKRACIAFIEQQGVPEGPGMGRGNFYGALAMAMSDPNADTIFFLSDGGPSHGEYELIDRLVFEVGKINKFQRYAINTILFGESEARGFHRAFMDDLASQNDGHYYPKY